MAGESLMLSQFAARVDGLFGQFVTLQSQMLAEMGEQASLQRRLADLFCTPVTGAAEEKVERFRNISEGVCLGFEESAEVRLKIEPKRQFLDSPEHYLNRLAIAYDGPSSYFTIEAPFDWPNLTGASRCQFSLYGTPSRPVDGHATLRMPRKDGSTSDHRLLEFALRPERRHVNAVGTLDFGRDAEFDTGKPPRLLIFLDPAQSFTLDLDYLNLYFV